MRLFALTTLMLLISGCATVVSSSDPDLIPEPIPWTAEDQELLIAARQELRRCALPMLPEHCRILLEATTELGTLRLRNRAARDLLSERR